MTELREAYESKGPELQRAAERLRSILREVDAKIEDRRLVRAEVRRGRIKELSSLQRKAEKSGWNADEALWRCSDLIGGRVVCNNVEDVHRFAELLKECLHSPWGDFDVQDHIKEPKDGYRALHLNFRLDVGERPFQQDLVPCEVQIRSRLQDAWAELSHDDIFKQLGLPEDLRARAKDLAEVLAAADKIASDIRSRVAQEIASPTQRPDLGRVSAEGLAYSFREVFGRSPPDYAVRLAFNLCDQLKIVTLEQLSGPLARVEFRDRVAKTYQSIIGVGIGAEDILLAALYAVAEGENKAVKWVRRKARREWREIEEFAAREALSSLPDTVEHLISSLEEPGGEPDIEGWAEALGATRDCAICGTTIVQRFGFAEAAVQHYEPSEAEADEIHERIEGALFGSDAETGGWGEGSLCAYHNDQAAKDD